MCELWSSAVKDRAFWPDARCFHSYSAVPAWQNRKVSRRCAFDLIVSNRVNLSHTRHLNSNTVVYRCSTVLYSMLLHTVLQWQQQNINQALNSQKTPCHVQAMGCLLWGSGSEKRHRYDTITLYMNILNHNWLGSKRHVGELWIDISSLAGIMASNLVGARAPSQYKDRLIYVWRFPC